MDSATRSLLQYIFLPALFLLVHTLAVIAFAVTQPAAAGPESDSAAMGWLLWVYVDFPLGLVSLWALSSATSNTLAVLSVLLIGGLQWILWGLAANSVMGWLRNLAR